jgi:hypothetical protein
MGGVDAPNFRLEQRHSRRQEPRPRSHDLVPPALSEHHPGLAGAHQEVRDAVHHHDAVRLGEAGAQRARAGEPAEATPEDDGRGHQASGWSALELDGSIIGA